jgi:hypothetical protein
MSVYLKLIEEQVDGEKNGSFVADDALTMR